MYITHAILFVGLILHSDMLASKIFQPKVGAIKPVINGKTWAQAIKPTLTPIPEETPLRSDGAENPLRKTLEKQKDENKSQ